MNMMMDSVGSLLQIVAGFGLSLALGFGVSYTLMPAAVRRHALLVAPTAGYALFCLAVIAASGNFRLPATSSTWIAAALLGASTFWAVFQVSKRHEWRELWDASRFAYAAIPVLLLVAFWPVLYQGIALYLGTANPDFYQSLAYQEGLLRYRIPALAPRPAIDASLNPLLALFPDPLPARFGGVMFSILHQELLGVPARDALMTSIVVFLLGLPLATFLLCRTVLAMSERVAFLSALLIATSAPVVMSFIHVLVGQNSALALLPLCIAICHLALTMRSRKLVLLSMLLLSATFWIYVMVLPYVLAPIGLFAIYDLTRHREGALRWAFLAVAASVGVFLVLHLGMLGEVRQLVREITELLGRSNKAVYVDFLTELSLPYALGLSSYPLGASFLFNWLATRLNHFAAMSVFAIATLAVVTFYFYSARLWESEASSRNKIFVRITLGVYIAVALYFNFVSPYGYAIFKMASWLQFFLVPFLAYGFNALIVERRAPRRGHLAAGAIAFVFVAGNLLASLDFGVKGMGRDRYRGAIANSYGIGGNPDYVALESALKHVARPGQVVGIMGTDYIANLWAAYYVVKAGLKAYFVSHDDFPDEDAILPPISGSASAAVTQSRSRFVGAGHADYFLLANRGNLNQEIVAQSDRLQPLWSNDSFLLVPADSARDVVATGLGFYRLEYFDRDQFSWWWPDKMRWTPGGGEILLINAGRPDLPHRLSYVAIAGTQREMPRTLELWVNGKLIDETRMQSAARIVSKPFHVTGAVDKLVIRIKERVPRPPRNFGLWNRQLPADQRELNVVMAQVRVLRPGDPAIPTTKGTSTARELLDSVSRFNGITLDGWASDKSFFELPVIGGARKALLSIQIPGWSGFRFPFVVRFRTNGQPVEKRFEAPGDHAVEFDIEPGGRLLLEMEADQSTILEGVGRGSFLIKSLAVR